MHTLIRRLFLAAVLSVVAACAIIPRTITLSPDQIQTALDRRFPRDVALGDLLNLRVGAPRVALQPEANRILLGFPADVTDRIVHRTLHGDLALSFGLRYEPSDMSIRATAVRIEHIGLAGVPPSWQQFIQNAGAPIAQQLLEDAVLHTFQPQDIQRAGGRIPSDIRVTPAGIQLELVTPQAL